MSGSGQSCELCALFGTLETAGMITIPQSSGHRAPLSNYREAYCIDRWATTGN